MTPFPHSVESQAEVARALAMMRELEIRHLPVKQGDELVGVITERQAAYAEHQGYVAAVMSRDPYVVDSGRGLDEVLLEMVGRHVDCALVVHEERLAGIFTATDACRLLGQALHRLSPRGPGDEVA
jgi:acetoin utilization protein AcuB